MKRPSNSITRRVAKQIGAVTRLVYRDVGKAWLYERHSRRLAALYSKLDHERERIIKAQTTRPGA